MALAGSLCGTLEAWDAARLHVELTSKGDNSAICEYARNPLKGE
jgi:hypothetical protein